MITTGLVTREEAAQRFDFLAHKFRGRRAAIRAFTHRDPDFVFWIYPDGRLCNAFDSHLKHPPKGFEYILNDEPDYCGFLRGRIASWLEDQLVVVYCREEALARHGEQLAQFLNGMQQVPVSLDDKTLIVSDNGDIYGTLEDLEVRQLLAEP